jgi:serine/threonine-protein kinase
MAGEDAVPDVSQPESLGSQKRDGTFGTSMHPLIELQDIDQRPAEYLANVGYIFATFGTNTQDSGNISYGVTLGSERFFVKTPGLPEDTEAFLDHPKRIALLRNAIEVARSCKHDVLSTLHNVIESLDGPMLVYSWAEGELIGVPRAQRFNSESSFQRFKQLSSSTICGVLDQVYELHHALADSGWIAVDFYDGSLIFDFPSATPHVVDLDMYSRGPFVNEMGRMFGSSRFMAPEEFEKGSLIDQRSNVFTMGRAAFLFLSDGSTDSFPFRGTPELFDVVSIACQPDPDCRFDSLHTFYQAWSQARCQESSI